MTARSAPRSPSPAQLAARRRTATSPQTSPASSAIPMAPATAARRDSNKVPRATGTPTAHVPTSPTSRTPTARPVPNAIVIHRIGGRIGRRQAGLTA